MSERSCIEDFQWLDLDDLDRVFNGEILKSGQPGLVPNKRTEDGQDLHHSQLDVIHKVRESSQANLGFLTFAALKDPGLQRLAIWASVCGHLDSENFWLNVKECSVPFP